jgi:hypothetical protein
VKPLCPPCQAARLSWLDYRLPHSLGVGATVYDSSPAGIRDRQRGRFEEWRSTIRFHRDLIARTCRASGHVAVPPPARVVQLDLLAAIEQREVA